MYGICISYTEMVYSLCFSGFLTNDEMREYERELNEEFSYDLRAGRTIGKIVSCLVMRYSAVACGGMQIVNCQPQIRVSSNCLL